MFLGQIVIDKTWRAQDVERRLPKEGMLLFFAQLAWLPDDDEDGDYGEACSVMYFENTQGLELHEPPDPECVLPRGYAITPRARLTLPHPSSTEIRSLQMSSEEHTAYFDVLFLEAQPDEGDLHMMFGHPNHLAKEDDAELHLIQIDSDNRVGLSIGDAQPFRIFVTGDDLTDPEVLSRARGTISSDVV